MIAYIKTYLQFDLLRIFFLKKSLEIICCYDWNIWLKVMFTIKAFEKQWSFLAETQSYFRENWFPVKWGDVYEEMFLKIGILNNFAIFTGKHLSWSLFLSKSTKKKLQHRRFLLNNAKFSRTAFFIEHIRWLFLYLRITFSMNIITFGIQKGNLWIVID